MKITCKGVVLSAGEPFDIQVETDAAGESLPELNITATGGHLDVYRNRVKYTGDISLHVFGEGKKP